MRPTVSVRLRPRMPATLKHLAGFLPTLAERVAGGGKVTADETVAEVVEIVTPPSKVLTSKMSPCKEQRSDTEVDRQRPNSTSCRATFDRTTYPGTRRCLNSTDEATDGPAELVTKPIELLHRRVVTLGHVVKVLFSDVHIVP